ncbi:unnamed protein product [Allacma fusca]|uniref:Uncharacterized protein n=1 Tax=Allacma fusca TaxID=39272 RepID=A0A8J2JCM6_9HEXA|nr:unnamed protein product [Allacma fusca]
MDQPGPGQEDSSTLLVSHKHVAVCYLPVRLGHGWRIVKRLLETRVETSFKRRNQLWLPLQHAKFTASIFHTKP